MNTIEPHESAPYGMQMSTAGSSVLMFVCAIALIAISVVSAHKIIGPMLCLLERYYLY